MDTHHQTSDRQSLLLNLAAARNLERRPFLFDQILATLDHWDRVAPKGSQRLRDEWRRMVEARDISPALADDERGRELRQASPLGRAISREERLEILTSSPA